MSLEFAYGLGEDEKKVMQLINGGKRIEKWGYYFNQKGTYFFSPEIPTEIVSLTYHHLESLTPGIDLTPTELDRVRKEVVSNLNDIVNTLQNSDKFASPKAISYALERTADFYTNPNDQSVKDELKGLANEIELAFGNCNKVLR